MYRLELELFDLNILLKKPFDLKLYDAQSVKPISFFFSLNVSFKIWSRFDLTISEKVLDE